MQENQNFLDKNTVSAILLILIIWLGWGYFNPPVTPVTKKTEVTQFENPSSKDSVAKEQEKLDTKLVAEKVNQNRKGELRLISTENFDFQLSSKGMAIEGVILHKYKDRKMEKIHYYTGKDVSDFETQIEGKPLFFDIKQISSLEYEGIYEDDDYKVKKIYNINPNKYSIYTSVVVESKKEGIGQIQTYLVDETLAEPEKSIFNPSFARQEIFVFSNNSVERDLFYLGNVKQESWDKMSVAALSSHYFTKAIIDSSSVIPKVKTSFDEITKETMEIVFYPKTTNKKLELNYISYLGPKKMSILESVDERLVNVVDFGFFSSIAKPILSLLGFLYNIFKNYGVAIIFLTILVRLGVLPFNIMSYKSMKAMQVIQPILKKIREKHKEDPVKMNQELMAVMKEHRVNPMGGCLPMLLQFPIFIALYQVLGQSIELYQEPFAFWIHDLSLKDPYYILPVLMGITMFLQQKLTPTTMDPTQAKVMMFMPVIFSFMMIALPSGLTLYIFISTLFAVIQQKILMKTV